MSEGAIALAVGCFATAQHLGGTGFISCYVKILIFWCDCLASTPIIKYKRLNNIKEEVL
jgi:hypothetical protein